MMTRLTFQTTRRSLFKAASAIAAAAGLIELNDSDVAAKNVTIFYLDPNCRSIPDTCSHETEIRKNKHSCNVCTACLNHAKNKRWATEEAITRAHPCCRCSVKQSKVPQAAFDQMFGTGNAFNPEFDLRVAA